MMARKQTFDEAERDEYERAPPLAPKGGKNSFRSAQMTDLFAVPEPEKPRR